MWQRLTEKARRIIFKAQEEARQYDVDILDSEHLLLALTRETDMVAFRVLRALNIPVEQVQSRLGAQMAYGNMSDAKDMMLSETMKRVIDYAWEEAAALNNPYVGTEHLLLGLLRDEEGLAGKTLRDTRAAVVRAQEESL